MKEYKIVHKAYKYRIYPNVTQKAKIHRSFGASRWVYNHLLAKQEKNNMWLIVEELVANGTLQSNEFPTWVKNNKKDSFGNKVPSTFFDKYRESTYLTQVKKHESTSWLSEIHSDVYANTISDLDNGYSRYYKKQGGKPKFKNRNSRRSISLRYSTPQKDPKVTTKYELGDTYKWQKNAILFEENKLKIPGLGVVRADVHRKPSCHRVLDVTVSQDSDLNYYASFTTEVFVEYEENKYENIVGIDLGIEHMVITSDGEKYEGAKSGIKYKDKLAREQRKLSKMVHGSNNYQKQKVVVAKIHKKITNERKHEINTLVHYLCSKYDVIVLEDLSSSELMKRSKSGFNYLLADMSWFTFKTRLEQKANEFGKEVIVINKWFASSQICSSCGHQDGKKELHVRFWECSSCGAKHDRDVNASINIKNEGIRVINSRK